MMIDTSLYTQEELGIFALFSYRCAKCGESAVTLHEIVPKSKRPKTWNEPSNRIPLCNKCHNFCHARGAKRVRDELRQLRYHSKYYNH